MTKKNSDQLLANYQKEKAVFLDSLQPDDFRNGGSFNQAELIIDQLNQALYEASLKKENSKDFITKAVTHLFRQDSPAVEKAINLSHAFLQTKAIS